MARLDGPRFCRICRTRRKCQSSWSSTLVWAIATSRRTSPYCTAERTDLVEAVWQDLSVQSTTVGTFDFSSLVILEHLRRRLERLERGEPALGPEIRGVLIFNGGLNRRAHPSVVHDADVAPPPRPGPPRRGPSPLTVQADARSKKDVVQKLPRNGSRTRRTPRRHGPSRRPVLPRRRRLRG